ncbi:MAG: hypothetical protein JXB88_17600 [Spirochaetales bacterium]|nr:hypothetical protein [Spirochaetales bacterium]
MSEIEILLKKSGYSHKAVELYINKVNLFKIKEADTNFLYTGQSQWIIVRNL